MNEDSDMKVWGWYNIIVFHTNSCHHFIVSNMPPSFQFVIIHHTLLTSWCMFTLHMSLFIIIHYHVSCGAIVPLSLFNMQFCPTKVSLHIICAALTICHCTSYGSSLPKYHYTSYGAALSNCHHTSHGSTIPKYHAHHTVSP